MTFRVRKNQIDAHRKPVRIIQIVQPSEVVRRQIARQNGVKKINHRPPWDLWWGKRGAAGAAPPEYPDQNEKESELKPQGVLEMRWRSPGISPRRDAEEDDDGPPRSISLSVSDVQTAVFHGVMLADLVRGDIDTIGGHLSGAPVTPKEELKKEPTKQEAKAELAKEESVKDEVCSVVTREREIGAIRRLE